MLARALARAPLCVRLCLDSYRCSHSPSEYRSREASHIDRRAERRLLGTSIDAKKRSPVTAANNIIPAAVRRASEWALFTACIFAVGMLVAYALIHYHVPCSQSAFVLRCVEWTDAEAAEGLALAIGMLCCAVLQVAAAAVALQLPCRRRWVRRALAYLALAVTTAGHCMCAAAMYLNLAADQGDLFSWICYPTGLVFFAWGDIVNFLALL